jgi:outer membrane protein insertion porin family
MSHQAPAETSRSVVKRRGAPAGRFRPAHDGPPLLRPALVPLALCVLVGLVLTTKGAEAQERPSGIRERDMEGAQPPHALAARADTLAGRPISRVLVEGNETAETKLILRTAGLDLGPAVDATHLRTALRSLYGLGLFSSVRVLHWPDSIGGRVLLIEVKENPRIASIAWKGNKKLSEEDLKGKIDLKTGQLLSRRKLFEAERAVELAYQEQGYAGARITPMVGAPEAGKVEMIFQIDEGRKVEIRAVEFAGNQFYSDRQLLSKLKLKPNSLFHRKRFSVEKQREDQGRLEESYHNNGFKDAKVALASSTFSEDDREVRLRYAVEEGPRYVFGHVQWSGNKAVPTEALNAAAAIVAGASFSQAKLDATTSAAYELYTEKGYLLELSIQPETKTAGDTVDVAYAISEGEPSHINEVTILGNTRTKERVIRRELTLIPGNLLRRSVLLRSQRDVFALGFFNDVQIDYQPAGEGSQVDVSFNVTEKSSGTATAGAAYASDTGLTGFVEFGHNNLFGNGQSISLHLERGGSREMYDVSFTEPWVLGSPTSLGLQLYNTLREYDIYTEKQKGGGINLGRPWFFKHPDFSRVSLGYSLADVNYTDMSGVDSTSARLLRSSVGTASRLNFTFSRVSTDNPFYPTSGSRTVAGLEVSGGILGGEIDYYKPTVDNKIYFVPFWKPAIMIRNRLSYLGAYKRGASVPGSETFRLGGTRIDYLRGYPDYDVVPPENIRYTTSGQAIKFPGGNVAYTFTAEYQFPVVNPVHGVFFLDAGNAWNSTRDLSLGDLRKGVGLGIRLEIPMLGPVGFDYAYGIDRGKWQSHFIIGPAF